MEAGQRDGQATGGRATRGGVLKLAMVGVAGRGGNAGGGRCGFGRRRTKVARWLGDTGDAEQLAARTGSAGGGPAAEQPTMAAVARPGRVSVEDRGVGSCREGRSRTIPEAAVAAPPAAATGRTGAGRRAAFPVAAALGSREGERPRLGFAWVWAR